MEESTSERNWRALQENQRRFVEIVFKSGETIHAHLLGSPQDMGGNQEVIYDLLWTNRPASRDGHRGCAFCDDFEAIAEVQPLSGSKVEEYLAQQLKLRT